MCQIHVGCNVEPCIVSLIWLKIQSGAFLSVNILVVTEAGSGDDYKRGFISNLDRRFCGVGEKAMDFRHIVECN